MSIYKLKLGRFWGFLIVFGHSKYFSMKQTSLKISLCTKSYGQNSEQKSFLVSISKRFEHF